MNAKGVKIGAIIIGFGGGYTISEVDTAVGEYAANQIAPLFFKMASLDEERSLSEQLGHTNELIFGTQPGGHLGGQRAGYCFGYGIARQRA